MNVIMFYKKYRRKFLLFITLICISLILNISLYYYMINTKVNNKAQHRLPKNNKIDFRFLTKNYIKKNFKSNHFNVSKSDQIGGSRELPDTRPDSCLSKRYQLHENISVSVIIVHYNEARSTLLRTLTSVLQRSPYKYLKEIIIIDDFSDDELQGFDLKILSLLSLSVSFRIIRNARKLGIIESRNKGVQLTISKYLVFLDSHCEVNINWMEPLLSRLHYNKQLAVSPVLDSIDSDTFIYRKSNSYLKGGFDWKLNFKWIPMSFEEKESKIAADSFVSPLFSGGIFMISREWFLKLNGFNSLLKIWGGESIEMAIKLWLCGGQIEIVPCSRVGHLFRTNFHQQQLHNDSKKVDVHSKNLKIIADLWLDEYKIFFYSLKPKLEKVPVVTCNIVNKLKTDLQCKSFSWFRNVVFPELKLPNDKYIAFGKLTSGSKCLTVDPDEKLFTYNTTRSVQNSNITMKSCYNGNITYWSLHKNTGKLSIETDACLNLNENYQVVLQQNCDTIKNTLYWSRYRGHLIHSKTKLCLDNYFKDKISVRACQHGMVSQLFNFIVEI